MDVTGFLYERFGCHLLQEEGGGREFGWALSSVLLNKEGKRVSLRGPGKPSILVSGKGVWIQTNFMPPPGLPPHIHWGVERVFDKAVRDAEELGVWFGVQLASVGPDKFLPRCSLNHPGSEVFAFHLDSGRDKWLWRPKLAREVVEVLKEAGFSCLDQKTVFALIDSEAGARPWTGKALTRDQSRAARRVYNLVSRGQPEALLPEGRRGLRAAINVLLEGESDA